MIRLSTLQITIRTPPCSKDINQLLQGAFNKASEVLISVHTEAQSRYLLHKQPSARIQVRSCLGGARSYMVAIAVRPEMPDLQRWLDTFLEVELLDLTAEELLQFGEREELWP